MRYYTGEIVVMNIVGNIVGNIAVASYVRQARPYSRMVVLCGPKDADGIASHSATHIAGDLYNETSVYVLREFVIDDLAELCEEVNEPIQSV